MNIKTLLSNEYNVTTFHNQMPQDVVRKFGANYKVLKSKKEQCTKRRLHLFFFGMFSSP